MTAPATAPQDALPAAPEKASLWEDLIDIFYAPSQVYARRRDARFGLALAAVILATALLVGLFWNVLQPIFEATVELGLSQAAAKGQEMPPEAMSTARKIGTTMAGVAAVVMVPLGILATSALVWIFGRLLDATTSFGQAMAIVTLAQVPRVLGWVVIGVQGLLGTPDKPIFSYLVAPTRFVDPESVSATVLGLLARFELFTLWATVLIAIGVAVMARVPRAKGAMVAAAVWLVAAGMSLLQGGG